MATRRVCIFFAASSEQRVVTLNVKCGLEGSARPCTHGVTFKNSVSVSAGTACCSCSQAVAPSMSAEASVDQVESNCPVAHWAAWSALVSVQACTHFHNQSRYHIHNTQHTTHHITHARTHHTTPHHTTHARAHTPHHTTPHHTTPHRARTYNTHNT